MHTLQFIQLYLVELQQTIIFITDESAEYFVDQSVILSFRSPTAQWDVSKLLFVLFDQEPKMQRYRDYCHLWQRKVTSLYIWEAATDKC